MDVKDNKVGVPMEFYVSKFSAADPEEMSRRSGVPYENGAFTVKLMGREVSLSWPDMKAVYTDKGEETKSNIRILIARLVMEGTLTAWNGKMLAYSEMPWGNVYEAQFNGRCIKRLAFGYGFELAKFEVACLYLGGIPAKGGDKAFDIQFLNGLTVRLILWEGDDEFPPSSQILFSDNFPSAFSAEDIAVTGDIIINAMKCIW